MYNYFSIICTINILHNYSLYLFQSCGGILFLPIRRGFQVCTLVSSTSKKHCLIEDKSKSTVQVANMFLSDLNMILDICMILAATQAVAAHAVREICQFLVPICERKACGNTNKYLKRPSSSGPAVQGLQHVVSHYTGVSKDHSKDYFLGTELL